MRIHTVKKSIRSNHTIRFGSFQNSGTKQNAIVSGFLGSDKINYSEQQDITVGQSVHHHPRIKYNSIIRIKYNSTIRCCQKCVGTRLSCKVLFMETNQYGMGIYRQGKKYAMNMKQVSFIRRLKI